MATAGLSRSATMLAVLIAGSGALSSCAHSSPTRPAPENGWVLVQVRSAEIDEESSEGVTWDRDVSDDRARQRERTNQAAIGVVGFLAPELAPFLGLLSAMGAEAPSGETDPVEPDVRVRAEFRHGDQLVTLGSTIAQDALHPQWELAFYVHLGALTEEGVLLRFEDVETVGTTPASLGDIRLDRSELRRAVVERIHDLDVHGGAVHSARISVSVPHGVGEIWRRSEQMELPRGLVALPQEVPAGAVVVVRARGGGRIGSGARCPPIVDVAGTEASGCESYNLDNPALRDEPHGAAVALVGREPSVLAQSVAHNPFDPCRVLIAPNAGPLIVGINDRDFRNNTGEFVFDIEVFAPVRLPPAWWGEDWDCSAQEMAGSWP